MSGTNIDLQLNEINKLLSITNSKLQETEQISTKISSKVPSRPAKESITKCSKKRNKTKHDIDIDYAIELLKKDDQNINVYNHLQSILDKILLERPPDPLGNFEKYSIMLKRSYIQKEVYFERVFVDNINRPDCNKRLQMYKCVSKKQFEKQKKYLNDKNVDKKANLKIEATKIESDNNNVNDGDDNVQVQNLWEANYMFNKAGCGLSTQEVSLLSITMDEMSRLNKFKNIRFWGKIFGLKKTYFIIECEWTDMEQRRKLSRLNISKLKPSSKGEKDKGSINTLQASLKHSVTSTDLKTTDESIDSTNSQVHANESSQSKLEVSSYNLPPERFGIGTNKNVYFVTNDLNRKWIELESVQPHHIVKARKIKRYFTGNLHEPINSYPKFDGLEIHYLRAQIARISASTQVCPQGFYVVDKAEKSQVETSNSQSKSESNTNVHNGLILNKNFKPISNKNLIYLNNWMHKNLRIDSNGITNFSAVPSQSKLAKLSESMINSLEEYYFAEEGEENFSYDESLSKLEPTLYGNLSNDTTIDKTPAWKGLLCSPFNSRYSYTMMKSIVWPGAYSIAHESQTDFLYMGWAQKEDFSWYSSSLVNEVHTERVTAENCIEFQDSLNNEQATQTKQKLQNHKTKRQVYKEKESIINELMYEG